MLEASPMKQRNRLILPDKMSDNYIPDYVEIFLPLKDVRTRKDLLRGYETVVSMVRVEGKGEGYWAGCLEIDEDGLCHLLRKESRDDFVFWPDHITNFLVKREDFRAREASRSSIR